MVLDPTPLNHTVPIPPSVVTGRKGHPSLASRRLPITAFGEFHQLCLAYPLLVRSNDPVTRTYDYLQRHRKQTDTRRSKRGVPWFAFQSASSLCLPPAPRVLLKRICSGGDFTLDVDGTLLFHSSVYLLTPTKASLDPFYLLGVFNSRVFWAFVCSTMPTMGEGRHTLRVNQLQRFPLLVPAGEPAKALSHQIVVDVRRLLTEDLLADRGQIVAQIEDRVAELYGVNPAGLT